MAASPSPRLRQTHGGHSGAEGHCGLPPDELVPLAATLPEIPAATVAAALELERADGAVVADTIEDRPCAVLAGLHRPAPGGARHRHAAADPGAG